MDASDAIPHGTYGGYQQELRRGMDPCNDCREALSVYQTQRRRQPQFHNARRMRNAKVRALWRLAELHPIDMKRLYEAELAKPSPVQPTDTHHV